MPADVGQLEVNIIADMQKLKSGLRSAENETRASAERMQKSIEKNNPLQGFVGGAVKALAALQAIEGSLIAVNGVIKVFNGDLSGARATFESLPLGIGSSIRAFNQLADTFDRLRHKDMYEEIERYTEEATRALESRARRLSEREKQRQKTKDDSRQGSHELLAMRDAVKESGRLLELRAKMTDEEIAIQEQVDKAKEQYAELGEIVNTILADRGAGGLTEYERDWVDEAKGAIRRVKNAEILAVQERFAEERKLRQEQMDIEKAAQDELAAREKARAEEAIELQKSRLADLESQIRQQQSLATGDTSGADREAINRDFQRRIAGAGNDEERQLLRQLQSLLLAAADERHKAGQRAAGTLQQIARSQVVRAGGGEPKPNTEEKKQTRELVKSNSALRSLLDEIRARRQLILGA